jgi:hypothetical protein
MGKRPRSPEPEPKEPSAATAAATAMIDESRELAAKPPKTSIHRIDPENGDRKFIARVTTDLATEEWLARKFGPGKYALTHQIVGENGSYKYHSVDTFLIDESAVTAVETVDDKPPTPPAAGAPAVVAPSGANILDRALEAGVLRLLEQSNRMAEFQTAMLERIVKAEPARAAGPSTLEIIGALTPLLAPVLAEIFKSRGDPTKNAIELAAILAKRDGGGTTLEALERGINIAHKLGAGADRAADDAGGMLPVVGKGIEVLGGIVDAVVSERRAARGDAGPPTGEPAASVDGRPPLTLIPNEPMALSPDAGASSSSDRLWISVVRPQIPSLLAAARFIPPGAAAETIAANLSPAALEDLLADINDETEPKFGGRLAAVFPEVGRINPEWFKEMLRTLLEITSDENEETATTPAPAAARGK